MCAGRGAAVLILLSLASCADGRDAACQGEAARAALTKVIAERAVTGAQAFADQRAPGSGATASAFQSVSDGFVLGLADARAVGEDPVAKVRCAARLSITVPKDIHDKANSVAAMLGRGSLQDRAKARGVDLEGTTFRTDAEYSIATGDDGDALVAEFEGVAKLVGVVRDLLVATVLEQRIRSEYAAAEQEARARAEAQAIAADPARADELAELLERDRRTDNDESADEAAVGAERAAAVAEAAARGL